MSELVSCSVGVAVPQEFHNQLEGVQRKISCLNPNLEPIINNPPHIVLLNLNLREKYLEYYKQELDGYRKPFVGNLLTLGGYRDYCSHWVVSPVVDWGRLERFTQDLRTEWAANLVSRVDFPSYPYLPLAHLREGKTSQDFGSNKKRIIENIKDLRWTIKIEEVGLYPRSI